MITIKAEILLYQNRGRTLPIRTGYKPLFNFVSESKKSGIISLINQEYLEVGNKCHAFIKFTSPEYLGNDFLIGKKFTFDEGTVLLGEGQILEILETSS